ncbi:glycosyl hydrolase family 28-related protein [Sphingomonas sp. S2-65]|uniref:glycosyl hydrolase family 28-related protein n=1 Tax=Sphingomonas sp. S2-65 TaxID=2903960 RepID=UPI001F1F22FE|nr:glycosyl hydrolase family 28-related protein [Sphingomonas sp. S2-65]UYY59314.1 glycosyl hydrolase family 28-related protein [Sphingomonas sp. S2-65]
MPFVEYEAENAETNGARIGPDRRFGTLAAEASGRQAVRLEGLGKHVTFTLGRPANALTLRYAIPDGADGKGLDATIGVYVAGERIAELPLTSRYGWYYGRYPFSNDPAQGGGHHFFDHARLRLPRTLPRGTRVQLRLAEQDRAPWVAVDLADFERVGPPLPKPAGALSLLRFGVDAEGRRDSGAEFRRAVAATKAAGRTLWIPPGTYRIDGQVAVDRVTIAGAGMWHSVLRGEGLGFYGSEAPHPSQAVVLRDFAVLGEVTERKDTLALSGIGGAMGGGSRIERLWLQHHKVGLWFDGPMEGIRASGLRIFDMTADGLNFHRGVSDAVMENSFVRGTGDDGLAAWSSKEANRNIVFRNNTVIAPVLANGIAIYGGRDMQVRGNVVADTITQGGGLHLGNRFKAVPLAGRFDITDNLLLRAGSFDPNWLHGVGALWFYALDAPIGAAIDVSRLDIVESSEEALMFTGSSVSGVTLRGIHVVAPGTHVAVLRSAGKAALSDIDVQGLTASAILACHSGFRLALGARVTGFGDPAVAPCGPVERR